MQVASGAVFVLLPQKDEAVRLCSELSMKTICRRWVTVRFLVHAGKKIEEKGWRVGRPKWRLRKGLKNGNGEGGNKVRDGRIGTVGRRCLWGICCQTSPGMWAETHKNTHPDRSSFQTDAHWSLYTNISKQNSHKASLQRRCLLRQGTLIKIHQNDCQAAFNIKIGPNEPKDQCHMHTHK